MASLAPARVLLAEEVDGGHLVRLAWIGAALKARGIPVDLASPWLHAKEIPDTVFDRVFQAPLLPCFTRDAGGRRSLPARSYADLLHGLDFDDANVVARQVQAWRSLLDAARPAMVVAEFAPGLMLAARGRMPVVAVGTPFTVPCAADGRFPAFSADDPGDEQEEQVMLGSINAALRYLGDAPLPDLPSAVAADARLPTGFTEFDPFAALRPEPLLPPTVEQCAAARGGGDEIAVFLSRELKNDPVIVAALFKLDRPLRLDSRASTPSRAISSRAAARKSRDG